MLKKNFLNFSLACALTIFLLQPSLFAMKKITKTSHVQIEDHEQDMPMRIRTKPVPYNGGIALACHYPFDTEKMTIEAFSRTEKYRKFMALGAPEMKTNTGALFKKPNFTEELEESVYRTCPDKVKEVINQCRRIDRLRPIQINRLPNIVILHGEGGTGKSELIPLISNRTNRNLVFINSVFLENAYIDSQRVNLREILNSLVNQNSSNVIGIEDAELLKESTLNLICEFATTYPCLAFVLTVNHLHDLEQWFVNLIERNGIIINVPLPDEQARKHIINYLVRKRRINYSIDGSIAQNTGGFDIRDLERLVQDSYVKVARRVREQEIDKKEINNVFDITNEDVETYKKDRSEFDYFRERLQKYNEGSDDEVRERNNVRDAVTASCIGILALVGITIYLSCK